MDGGMEGWCDGGIEDGDTADVEIDSLLSWGGMNKVAQWGRALVVLVGGAV